MNPTAEHRTKLTVLVVPPGVGHAPSPMRKKMNLSMAIVKSRFTNPVVSGTEALGPTVLDAACVAPIGAMPTAVASRPENVPARGPIRCVT